MQANRLQLPIEWFPPATHTHRNWCSPLSDWHKAEIGLKSSVPNATAPAEVVTSHQVDPEVSFLN